MIRRPVRVLVALIALSLAALAAEARAATAELEIRVNGEGAGPYAPDYAYLFRKEGGRLVQENAKFKVAGGVAEVRFPDNGEFVAGAYLPGGASPVHSAPLRPGRSVWDIRAAIVRLSGGAALEGKEVSLFTLNGATPVNLWKKARIKDGSFMLPMPDAKEYLAGVTVDGGRVRYMPLKAGLQEIDPMRNSAPRLGDIPAQTVEAGGRLTVNLTATDMDGERVRFELAKAPGFALLKDWGDSTGAVALRPPSGVKGTFQIEVAASDGKATVRQAFSLAVSEPRAEAPVYKGRAESLPRGVKALPGSQLTAVWANDGTDKVAKEELRATAGKAVKSPVWDGSSISLFGARNEVVSFSLVLEAGLAEARGISIEFNRLTGPGNSAISSKAAGAAGVFDYRDREIELFYVRYLQIKGLSRLAYEPSYDERHVPRRLQLPYTLPKGSSRGAFADRPDAYRRYPDIAVPVEAVGEFGIAARESQMVWADIYIPGGAKAGVYRGTLKVTENGRRTVEVPVSLEVLPFALPDEPAAKTMLYLSEEDTNDRYLGRKWPDPSKEPSERLELRERVWRNHHLLAHRHRISLIDDGMAGVERMERWRPVLSGKLFTEANGYEGPGSGVGSGVYSIGTYGVWRRMWDKDSERAMHAQSDRWVEWFERNYPATDYFLYLFDEPKAADFASVQRWASWVDSNPGPGRRLKTMSTVDIVRASREMPSLDIALLAWGDSNVVGPVAESYRRSGRPFWGCNGWRVATGSFAVEDEGVSLRALGWTQFKHKVERWFYWDATHYKNRSHVSVETNVFREAWTFGRKDERPHPKYGETGHNYNNGDGVLFYPGIERRFPEDSYGVPGPIASLRLKLWRRGLQDAEYLYLAEEKDREATARIVNRMVPKVLWEVGVTDPKDPTYVHTDVSWPLEAGAWEAARRELAEIIAKKR